MKRRVRLLLAASLTVALLALAAVTVLHVRNSSTSRLRFQSKPGLSAKANYALLPDSEVASYAKLFPSDSRADISGWEPTARDIVGLEGNLYQIATLREAPGVSPAVKNMISATVLDRIHFLLHEGKLLIADERVFA